MRKLSGLPLALVLCFALATLLFSLGGCSRETDTRVFIPLPKLPDGPVELRVAHLENGRLLQLGAHELQLLLDSARDTVKAHLGVDVRFTAVGHHAIEAFYQRLPKKVYTAANEWIYDFKNGRGDGARLKKAFEADLRKTGDDLDAMIGYAQPYLVKDVRARSFEGLAEALIATQLARLEQMSAEKAPDGRPLIDDRPYNEFVYWDFMAFADFPYEVVLTNQLLASVEYIGNSVHSALRGGISNGLTTPNPQSRVATTAVVSYYPFVGVDAVTRGLRGNESYSREDAARYAGVILAHEIGHQLFHLGHPYGRTACLMNPTPLLRFRQWVEGLAPAQCPVADSGAMKPGYAKFHAVKTD